MAKQARTIRKQELVTKLNWLERKNKNNQEWDTQVKTMFQTSGSFSFEELVIKNTDAAEQLVAIFE